MQDLAVHEAHVWVPVPAARGAMKLVAVPVVRHGHLLGIRQRRGPVIELAQTIFDVVADLVERLATDPPVAVQLPLAQDAKQAKIEGLLHARRHMGVQFVEVGGERTSRQADVFREAIGAALEPPGRDAEVDEELDAGTTPLPQVIFHDLA